MAPDKARRLQSRMWAPCAQLTTYVRVKQLPIVAPLKRLMRHQDVAAMPQRLQWTAEEECGYHEAIEEECGYHEAIEEECGYHEATEEECGYHEATEEECGYHEATQ